VRVARTTRRSRLSLLSCARGRARAAGRHNQVNGVRRKLQLLRCVWRAKAQARPAAPAARWPAFGGGGRLCGAALRAANVCIERWGCAVMGGTRHGRGRLCAAWFDTIARGHGRASPQWRACLVPMYASVASIPAAKPPPKCFFVCAAPRNNRCAKRIDREEGRGKRRGGQSVGWFGRRTITAAWWRAYASAQPRQPLHTAVDQAARAGHLAITGRLGRPPC